MQIRFEHISKEYLKDAKVLDDVSFEIDAGEFVFLVGPSGAGKSTLVKFLIRDDLPTSGDVYFDNQSVASLTKEEIPALRRKIGIVFQDFKVLFSRTVFENVALALEVVDSPILVINEVVPNMLSMVGLSEFKDRFPQQLSGGELQRLSIARALAHEPDVLVADEPTGMIDPASSRQVMDLLEKVNAMGTTVLVATHDQATVDRMKKRVIGLEKGKVIFDKAKGTYNG